MSPEALLSDVRPGWYTQALQTPHQTGQVDSDGCVIQYLQWGECNKPLLLLVHGNGGHAHWWDFIAPAFMDSYCVVAIHLSGMGDSGHRAEYSFDSYAKDVIAVAQALGHDKQITLVGHSMGGIITMRTAENHPEKIKALVVIDSPLIFRRSDDASELHKPPPPARFQLRPKKYYPDAATALSHYHLVPAQPCKNTFLLQHVAQHSIRQYGQGWSWKFDDGINLRFKRSDRPPFNMDLIHCPLAYIYGGKSALVPQAVIPDIHALLAKKGPIFEIQEAHHHILLDEPLLLIDRIRDCLQSFRKNA